MTRQLRAITSGVAIRRAGFMAGFLLLLALFSIPVLAQTGGGYDLSWSTIDGGGGMFSTGGGYGVGGTVGQHDAGLSNGGGYGVAGGIWGVPSNGTTPVPTATPVATPTATAIPTPCPLQFTDVQPDNTFYTHVRCLACRGIDVGFPCGGPGEPCDPQFNNYWRPNSLITRDDLAHMVAGAAGFPEPPGPQRFEDVPPSHPFFLWINRMANRGLIGGYPCGTRPDEPCVPPLNLAYYRPYANATRGQIAKIVSNGAGFAEPPVGQFFTDVPPEQPFYEWIQRLASRNVMSGYPCGGPNEPCDPQDRPYFRWQNDSTRGQVGKITANTFFPNCVTP